MDRVSEIIDGIADDATDEEVEAAMLAAFAEYASIEIPKLGVDDATERSLREWLIEPYRKGSS